MIKYLLYKYFDENAKNKKKGEADKIYIFSSETYKANVNQPNFYCKELLMPIQIFRLLQLKKLTGKFNSLRQQIV